MHTLKQPLIKFKMDWLSDKADTPSVYDPFHDIHRIDFKFPEDVGYGWSDVLPLNIGCHVAFAYHYFHENLPHQLYYWTDLEAELAEPILTIHIPKCGKGVVQEKYVGLDLPIGQGMNIFQHVDKLHFSPLLDTSEPMEMAMLKIGMSFLYRMLGEENTNTLLKGVDVLHCPSASSQIIPENISNILFSICQQGESYSGELRRLFAEAKTLEYLTALTTHVRSDQSHPRKSRRHKLVSQLYDELINLEGRIPPLDDIASRYGLSLRTLNDEFKGFYGKPIWSFITDYRLDQAHEVIEKSDIALKLLADKLGYSHVNHFNNAFKRKFGYAPGSLRKQA